MKIRSGFVSNSSSSSFLLAYFPEDFDFDVHVEYLTSKRKLWEDLKRISESDIDDLKRTRRFNEQTDEAKFWRLESFLSDFFVLRGEAPEGCGEIRLINQNFFNKIKLIEDKTKKNYIDFEEKSKERKRKREELKLKHRHIDPFDEENWESIE